MYEARNIGKIYKTQQEVDMGFDDFIANTANAIAAINIPRKTIEMRNGDTLYFISVRNERDHQKIMGMQFNSIECRDDVDYESKMYLRSRLRSPLGEVDADLIIMGE